MIGTRIWFNTEIDNPKYSPYSSSEPRVLPYSGVGEVVHIDLNHYLGVVVIDNKTGMFIQMKLSDIHRPTVEEQKAYIESVRNK